MPDDPWAAGLSRSDNPGVAPSWVVDGLLGASKLPTGGSSWPPVAVHL